MCFHRIWKGIESTCLFDNILLIKTLHKTCVPPIPVCFRKDTNHRLLQRRAGTKGARPGMKKERIERFSLGAPRQAPLPRKGLGDG